MNRYPACSEEQCTWHVCIQSISVKQKITSLCVFLMLMSFSVHIVSSASNGIIENLQKKYEDSDQVILFGS